MSRLMISVLVVVLLGGFYGLYTLSLQVRQLQKETAWLERETRKEREAIRVLKAEWAYLNRPEYIQQLADQMELAPMVAAQVGRLDDLFYLELTQAEDEQEPDVPAWGAMEDLIGDAVDGGAGR